MLLKGTVIVSLLTIVSRLLGLIRDLLVARLLGASMLTDAFFVAFRVPNLLRSLAAEGALTSAFVPVFSSALATNREAANVAFKRVAGFVLFTTITLTVLGIIFSPEIISLLAPGFRDERALAEQLTQIMMPYIIFVSLIALLNSALNALGIFGASAWAQVIMNLVLIAGALCAMPFDSHTATIILAISVVIGGIAQVLAQVPASRKAGLPLAASLGLRSPEVRKVIKLMLPATVGASVYQFNIFLSTLLASLLVEGSVSWLFYADRVAQLPIGIFSVALASVLLPTLANASANSDSGQFRAVLADSLRFTSFVIIPMSAGIWALAIPITALIFGHGAFTHHSILMTAAAIQALAVGLWATSCYSMVVRAFIAKKDTITPSLIGIGSLVVYLIVALTLMGPIVSSSKPLVNMIGSLQAFLNTFLPVMEAQGHVGLALASSIAAFASLALAVTVYIAKLGAFPFRIFLRSTTHALFASLCMVSVVNFLTPFEGPAWIACLIGGTVGVLTYLAVTRILSSQELKETLTILKRFKDRP